jgi:hypothetical protein
MWYSPCLQCSGSGHLNTKGVTGQLLWLSQLNLCKTHVQNCSRRPQYQECFALPCCRWHYRHQVRDLLQLGREGFTPQLQSYLSDCPQLLWMSQVQAKQYSAATASLSSAAAAATAPDAKQLWALTKLSAKAAGNRDSGRQLRATAAVRLRQLQLQAQLLPGRQQPMLAEELASAALKTAGQAGPVGGMDQCAVGLQGPDAAIAAVEVLALEAKNSNTNSYRCVGWCQECSDQAGSGACRHVWFTTHVVSHSSTHCCASPLHAHVHAMLHGMLTVRCDL